MEWTFGLENDLDRVWHYACGVALSATGQADEAETKRNSLSHARATFVGGEPLWLNAGLDVLSFAVSVLDGRIAAAKGERKAAIAYF